MTRQSRNLFKVWQIFENGGSLIYGPAVPRIYRECKRFGFQPIFEPDKPVLDVGLESFLKVVADVFLPIDAYQLDPIT